MTQHESSRDSSSLSIWTVYDHPRDYPGSFVARRFQIGGMYAETMATSDMFIAATLDELRALLPPGLTCISRSPDDDLVILECWL